MGNPSRRFALGRNDERLEIVDVTSDRQDGAFLVATMERLEDYGKTGYILAAAGQMLDALMVADAHLARIGVPTNNETRMTLRAAIFTAEGRTQT